MRPSIAVVICSVFAVAAGVVFADEPHFEGSPSRDPLVLDWWSMDGGGGPAAGGAFELLAVIGQPDVGISIGGPYFLHGGLLAGRDHQTIFADDFEQGTTGSWSSAVGEG